MDGGDGVRFGLEVLHAHQLLHALLRPRPGLQWVSQTRKLCFFCFLLLFVFWCLASQTSNTKKFLVASWEVDWSFPTLSPRPYQMTKTVCLGVISSNNGGGVGFVGISRDLNLSPSVGRGEPRWSTCFRGRLTNQTIKRAFYQDERVNKHVLILPLPSCLIHVAAEGSPLMIYSILSSLQKQSSHRDVCFRSPWYTPQPSSLHAKSVFNFNFRLLSLLWTSETTHCHFCHKSQCVICMYTVSCKCIYIHTGIEGSHCQNKSVRSLRSLRSLVCSLSQVMLGEKKCALARGHQSLTFWAYMSCSVSKSCKAGWWLYDAGACFSWRIERQSVDNYYSHAVHKSYLNGEVCEGSCWRKLCHDP